MDEPTQEPTTQVADPQTAVEDKKEDKHEIDREDEELPEHFYDSDIASVNEKDFMSDNEPPKDIVHERKLLHKEKLLHIFKTIVQVGHGIDKPAPYDEITLRYREEVVQKDQQNLQAKSPTFLQKVGFETYNLGLKHEEIERLVISMKAGESAMFELEELEVSKKSNIKVLKGRRVMQVEVKEWITVIDIDSDLKYLKYVLQRGQGPHRVSKFDEVSFSAVISLNDVEVYNETKKQLRIEEEEIEEMPSVIWKMLSSMKKHEISQMKVRDMHMQQCLHNQPELYEKMLQQFIKQDRQGVDIKDSKTVRIWKVRVEVHDIQKVDDFYLDGSILKKILIKGVSTAKPDSSSLMYYALKILGPHKQILHQDPCFNSDWWQDFVRLDELGCRKVHLDEYKISKFLKASMKRMKPAEVAEIECRDLSLFQYGTDYQELRSLWPKQSQFPPKRVFLIVRVYNFTDGFNCFNMTIEQKVEESRRKKPIAVSLLAKGEIKKALKRFKNIVSFYTSGDINQAAYDEKVSALMNSILCLMKQEKYSEMIPLCELVLEEPKHGFDQDKMKINGPQGLKVEGKVDSSTGPDGNRLAVGLSQNPKIIQKCLYRKALALLRTGESKLSLETLGKIENKSEEVVRLQKEAEKHLEGYNEKSKKIFKNMLS